MNDDWAEDSGRVPPKKTRRLIERRKKTPRRTRIKVNSKKGVEVPGDCDRVYLEHVEGSDMAMLVWRRKESA